MVKLLALDTSTLDASVALTAEEEVLAEATRRVTTHSEGLLQLVDDVLRAGQCALDDVDALVCGSGPGSFTGVRIGLATVKGLCFATGKPVVCICSLDALGMAAMLEVGPSRHALALLDARRGQLYGRPYLAGRPTDEPFVATPQQVAQRLRELPQPLLLGDGALSYESQLQALLPQIELPAADKHQIRAGLLARAAVEVVRSGDFTPTDQAVPIYLRPPDIRPQVVAAGANS